VSDASPSSPSSFSRRTASGKAGSLVVVPVLNEDIDVVLANLRTSAAHPAVGMVMAITGDHETTNQAIRAGIEDLGERVQVLPQDRLGNLRPGKGDAVNTGLKVFLNDTELDRIHFYDADIKTFDGEWISKAEAALDLGFEAVRHFYPRAATDAMITWMVTRPGFALLWPRSALPRLEQPLSGELAFTREAARVLAADPRVQSQSDWGVDTAITFATVAHGLSVYESYVAKGKVHALYSSLSDIKIMMVECLGALQRLRSSTIHEEHAERITEPSDSVSQQIEQQIGFDVEATQSLLTRNWSPGQDALLTAHFSDQVAAEARLWRKWPDTSWMNEATWLATLTVLLDRFVPDDDDWCELAFRLWVGRVLHYTLRIAVRGHAFADVYLHEMVDRAIAGLPIRT
jgi:mannosylglycerate synthase